MAVQSPTEERPPGRFARVANSDLTHLVLAVALDVVVVVTAYTAALMLRFDADIPHENSSFAIRIVPLLAVAFVAANAAFGVYRTVWAYGSLGDILSLFRPVLLVTAATFGINLFFSDRNLPLSVILIAGALVFPGMAVVKMRARLLRRLPWVGAASQRLLIVGAGHTGQLLARELQNSPSLNYQPVGFLDDDPKKLNSRIHGLRVLGALTHLEETIRRADIDVVAIAIPRAPGALIRPIVTSCQRANVPVRIVPGVENWVLGGHQTLRDITVDDLLGREPVEVDFTACSRSVRDRIVLVTGAAGSIGSELCRQVVTFQPHELHLVDNNESGLFDLASELAGVSPQTVIKLWPASVVDGQKVDRIFHEVRPQLVYHAAAFKHVPMLEEHPDEAFRANVLGTLNVVRAARTYEVGTFVLISTDKAVRPSSIMGATKRIAELMVIALARQTESTKFVAVRFGNVMGSRGSAPLTFMRQIERGGPVTITDPDMWRYFISIPEAVSLVIQAGTFGGSGKIYMLDMGEEVNMLELAERMIRLRGLRPGVDIEVVFTGTRPGEKLREELVADFEKMERTDHPKVMRLTAATAVSETELTRLVDEIEAHLRDDPDELRRRIHLVARKYSLDGEAEPDIEPAKTEPATS